MLYSATDPVVALEMSQSSVYSFTFVTSTVQLTVDIRDVHKDAISGAKCNPSKLIAVLVSEHAYTMLHAAGKFRSASTHKLCTQFGGRVFRFLVDRTKIDTLGLVRCAECGTYTTPDKILETEDHIMVCHHCCDTTTVTCNQCGCRWSDRSALTNVITGRNTDRRYCARCLAQVTTYTCNDCHSLVLAGSRADVREAGDPDIVCVRCCSTGDSIPLHNYSYKPNPKFRRGLIPEPTEHPELLFMGVELEIDSRNGYEGEDDDDEDTDTRSRERMARNIHAAIDPRHKMIYCKGDGSLSDRGVEIVSHPATLTYHQEWKWAQLLAYAKEHGYNSYAPGTCGIHVHVSRSFFQEMPYCSPMMHFGKMLYFYQKNKHDLEKFSLRSEFHYCSFSDMMSLAATNVEDTASSRWRCGGERYRAINMNNQNTVEFRMFRGTLHPTVFYANLEFLDVWLRAASLISFEAMKEWDMLHLLQTARVWNQDRYKHFIAFSLRTFPRLAETSFGRYVNSEILQLVQELKTCDYRNY